MARRLIVTFVAAILATAAAAAVPTYWSLHVELEQQAWARVEDGRRATLAALEATLALYRDPETARREIPVLRMLTEDGEAIRRRGEALREAVEGRRGGNATTALIEGESEVGGGSFPGAKLATWLVRLDPRHLTPDTLQERLRGGEPPIVARIADDRVVLDPRTIFPDQIEPVARAVRAALDA